LIVALAQQKNESAAQNLFDRLPIQEYDETRYAPAGRRALGTEHHEFQVTPDGVQILPQLIWHYDEPFADSSAIPTWYVSQLTRRHVTVALSGDGGDELFALPRYKAVALAAAWIACGRCGRCLGWHLQHLPSSATAESTLRRFKRFCEVLSHAAAPPLFGIGLDL